jgi:iron complex transport system substrate-binding protein
MLSLRRRTAAATMAVALSTLVLAACGTTDAAPEESSAPAPTMTVVSKFGTVTLPAAPKKALGMYTTDVDILITLGIPLAQNQPIRGDGWTDFPTFFPQAELENVKPFANYPDYNFEKILAAEPDFILNGLGYDADVVKKLPGIAPTYSVDAFDGRNWLEHFKETAVALGRVDKYDEWIRKYDARVAEVKAAIGERGKGLVVAPVSSYEGKVSSACYSGVECQAFRDVGLTVFPGAQRNGGKGLDLSLEQVGQLSAIDYAFTIQVPGAKGTAEYATSQTDLLKNPLWARLAFVQKEQIVPYDMEMTYGSPSGQMAFLDVIEKAIAP